jgi:hypothetical protein
MSMIKIYLYGPKKKVLVPTVAETEAGFFVEIEPLNIYEHHDVDGWTRGIARAMARGSKTVPTPDGEMEPGSQILDALHLNSWSEFEKEAVLFTVHRGARYISIYATGFGEDGMWSAAAMSERKFHSRAPIEAVLEALCHDLLCHPHMTREKPTLLIGRAGTTATSSD